MRACASFVLAAWVLLSNPTTATRHHVVADDEADVGNGTCLEEDMIRTEEDVGSDDATPHLRYRDWSDVLLGGSKVIANGNVFPPSPSTRTDECLLVLAHSFVLKHCPAKSKKGGRTLVLHAEFRYRFRGAFTVPGSPPHRVWLLCSPAQTSTDLVGEFDLTSGTFVQLLRIPDTVDCHDAVRFRDGVFIADTRSGDAVELALPPPVVNDAQAQAFAKRYATMTWKQRIAAAPLVTVVKRHQAFNRADHVNNLAVTDDLIVFSLHGKGALKPKIEAQYPPSATRISLLHRRNDDAVHALALDRPERGLVVDNVGTFCHGIAFHARPQDGVVELLGLDSVRGSLVSVVVVGPGSATREREVLWKPNLDHPVFTPLNDQYGRSRVHAKGLAVQGGVAYFNVSGSKNPKEREGVFSTLMVAYDLVYRKTLWARVVPYSGLINQLVTTEYLNAYCGASKNNYEDDDDDTKCFEWPEETGKEVHLKAFMEERIEEDAKQEEADREENEKIAARDKQFREKEAAKDLEASKKKLAKREAAKKQGLLEVLIGKEVPLQQVQIGNNVLPMGRVYDFDTPLTKSDACFLQYNNGTAVTKHIPLDQKNRHEIYVKHLCDLDVSKLQDYLDDLGEEAFLPEGQKTNAAMGYKRYNPEKFKPGMRTIFLTFSSKNGKHLYRFPWFHKFLPQLQESVFGPLRINPDRIMRMQLAYMTTGTEVNLHLDKGLWAQRAHRVHVPIVTHDRVTFLVQVSNNGNDDDDNTFLRIPSVEGTVYEVNNVVHHAVKNTGGYRVHLIIDWLDDDHVVDSITNVLPGQVCTYHGPNLHCVNGT